MSVPTSPSRAAQAQLAQLSQLMQGIDPKLTQIEPPTTKPPTTAPAPPVHPLSPTRQAFNAYQYQPAPTFSTQSSPQRPQPQSAPTQPTTLYSDSNNWRYQANAPTVAPLSTQPGSSTTQPAQSQVNQVQHQLASQMAADAELQQSLREFSQSLGRNVPNAQPIAPTATGPSSYATRYESVQSHNYMSSAESSQYNSMQSSAAASPNYGPTFPSHQPPPIPSTSFTSNYPALPTPSTAPYTTHTSKQLADIELAHHQAALAQARQRLIAMGVGLNSQDKFVPPYPNIPYTPSINSSVPPSEVSSTGPSVHFQPADHQHQHQHYQPVSQPQHPHQQHQPHHSHPNHHVHHADEDSLLNSTSSDDEDSLRQHHSHERSTSAERRPQVRHSPAKPAAASIPIERRPRSASAAPTRAASSAPSGRPVTSGAGTRVKAVPRSNIGTFGSSRSGPKSASVKKSSQPPPATSPTRPSPSKALVPQSQAVTEGSDDVSLVWAERYKTLLNKNLALQKKNKELTLRGQAYSSTVQELTATTQAEKAEKESLLAQLEATEEKLTACKNVLRSEREAQSFHVQKNLQQAEIAQVNEINKLRHEYETKLDTLERSNVELKKRGKNLQLLAHSVQTKLDNKIADYDQLSKESTEQIDSLQSSLTTTTAHLNTVNAKLAKFKHLSEERHDIILATEAKLQSMTERADQLTDALATVEKDRNELSHAFRALQVWSDSLLEKVEHGMESVQREASKVREMAERTSERKKEESAAAIKRFYDEDAHDRRSSQPTSPARSGLNQRSTTSPYSRYAKEDLSYLPRATIPMSTSTAATSAALAPADPIGSPTPIVSKPAAVNVDLLPRSSQLRQAWSQLEQHDETRTNGTQSKPIIIPTSTTTNSSQPIGSESVPPSSSTSSTQESTNSVTTNPPSGLKSPLSMLQEQLKRLAKA